MSKFSSRFFTGLAFGLLCSTMLIAQDLVITNASVIDGVDGKVQRGRTVVVSGGKIDKVESGEFIAPEGVETIDLRGRYLLPGFIDCHVHIRGFAAAKRALHSGVTTARSMGVSHFVDVGLRDLAKAGKIESPEIFAAGYHVRPQVADDFFINHPEHAGLLESKAKGAAAMRTLAQAMISHGVNWIKTNATERAGLPHTDPRKPFYTESELRALVEEAAKSGVPVAAHAHGEEGGYSAVAAGVKSIEHGTYLNEETLKLMVEKDTFLVPTIAVVSDLTMPGGDYDNPLLEVRGRHMLPRIRLTASNAHELGVKIAAATDTGYGPESTLRMSLELEEMVRIGMTPFEAIQTATVNAAELLGIEKQTGRLAAGFDADLVACERNPLEDIGALHDLLLVVNNGEVAVNRASFSP